MGGWKGWRKAMRLAAGIALPACVAACASARPGPGSDAADLPTLRGRYDLRATVRAGSLTREVQGVLVFLDDEWMTWEPGLGSRERVGPCRYHERGRRVEVDCGVALEITRTDRGLRARVEQGLREVYYETECVAWTTDASGRDVCVSSRRVERYRMVMGHGETLLTPLEGY